MTGPASSYIGSALQEYRAARGWSQHRLASALTEQAASVGEQLPKASSLITQISRWEQGHNPPGPFYRRLIAAVYDVGTDVLFGRALGCADSAGDDGDFFEVSSHKFAPAYVGPSGFPSLRFADDHCEWMPCQSVALDHQDSTATLYLFPFGVAVFHVVDRVAFGSIGELAVWRRGSYESVLEWTSEQLGLLAPDAAVQRAEYVLSLYALDRPMWPERRDLQTAMCLLSMPSVLLDREPGHEAIAIVNAQAAEQTLLRDGFEHGEVVDFGFAGTAIGCASWAGVAYHPLAPARALRTDEIARFELLVQALWGYCSHLVDAAERGAEPTVDPAYGRRFLKACESRLTAPRGQESTQHRLMREAVLTTSRLPGMLDRAMDVLADQQTQDLVAGGVT